VRYDTQNGLEQHLPPAERLRRVLRPRILVYSTVLLAIAIGVATSIALRSPFKVDVVRDRASLARIVDEGWIENVYRLQVMNATEREQRYAVRAEGLDGLALAEPIEVVVGPAAAQWVTVALRVPPQTAAAARPGAHEIHFGIERRATPEDAARTVREKSTFVVPR
jgi:polyferredoxin